MEQTGGMHAASTGTLATRCRQCLTGGLDAHALPGTDLCAVHSGGAASTDMIVDAIYTGLTQEMASASIQSAPPGLPPASATVGSGSANGMCNPSTMLATIDLQEVMSEFVEGSVLRDSELIQANMAVTSQRIQPPSAEEIISDTTSTSLARLLKILAYNLEDADHWKALGMAAYSGSQPSTTQVTTRPPNSHPNVGLRRRGQT